MIFRLVIAGALAIVVGLLEACDTRENDTDVDAGLPESLVVGKALYIENCKVCHAQGINGAPIVGNKKMWLPRVGKGIDALVSNAVNGVGLMPAKGGKTHLNDEEVRHVVEYYLHRLK